MDISRDILLNDKLLNQWEKLLCYYEIDYERTTFNRRSSISMKSIFYILIYRQMWTSFLSERQLFVWRLTDKHICPAQVSQRANKKHSVLSAHAKRNIQEVHAVNASIWAYGTLSSAGDLPSSYNVLFAPLMFSLQYMLNYLLLCS